MSDTLTECSTCGTGLSADDSATRIFKPTDDTNRIVCSDCAERRGVDVEEYAQPVSELIE